ncbi:ISAs1 family transposase [Pseudaeromonas sp. ZJS20]
MADTEGWVSQRPAVAWSLWEDDRIGLTPAQDRDKHAWVLRYYISSADLTEERFANTVRSHWGIENQLHWVLDVTMKEDACPIYRGDAAEILATARHMALNMLRAEEEKRASIRRKQKIAAMNSDYLEQVILAGIRAANKK